MRFGACVGSRAEAGARQQHARTARQTGASPHEVTCVPAAGAVGSTRTARLFDDRKTSAAELNGVRVRAVFLSYQLILCYLITPDLELMSVIGL